MNALIASELKQRLRGKRWWILLLIWMAILLLVTALIRAGAKHQAEFEQQFGGDFVEIGPTMFGTLALFVLGLMALVVPALSSTAINSERERGTLALLQSTLYRPREIALAKFTSSFLTALVYLAASVPLALWSASEGGVGFARAVIVYVILAGSAGLFVALGLAASSLIRRTALSTLAAYVAVFTLTAGMPILFGLSLLGAPQETIERTYPGGSFTETRTVIGWRWVLLAPDPFVVLADAAPRQRSRFVSDPLDVLRQGVRSSRRESDPVVMVEKGTVITEPGTEGEGVPLEAVRDPLAQRDEPPPLWPTGLAIQAGLIGLCAYEVLRKLKVPARRLAPGERVA